MSSGQEGRDNQMFQAMRLLHGISRVHTPRLCDTEVNLDVNCGLWVTLVYLWVFTDCRNHTAL